MVSAIKDNREWLLSRKQFDAQSQFKQFTELVPIKMGGNE